MKSPRRKSGIFFYTRIRPAHAWWGFCLADNLLYLSVLCGQPTKIFTTPGETVDGVIGYFKINLDIIK